MLDVVCSTYLISRHPSIRSTIRRQLGHRFQPCTLASLANSVSILVSVVSVVSPVHTPQCDLALHFLHVFSWHSVQVPTLRDRLLAGMKALQVFTQQYSLSAVAYSSSFSV